MKPIPIRAAAWIARLFGYSQVVIVARAVGESGGEHVTTFGTDKPNAGVAARMGNFFKHELMRWPDAPPGITCDGCQQELEMVWHWCPWCGAGQQAVAGIASAETKRDA